MPANPRRARDARNFPSGPSTVRLLRAQNKECRDAHQNDGCGGGQRKGKSKCREAPASRSRLFLSEWIKRRRGLVVAIAPQQAFQFLYFRVRLARAVPQVTFFHSRILLSFTHAHSLGKKVTCGTARASRTRKYRN